MTDSDVPSPIDLRDPVDAAQWERKAQARPGRADIFAAFLRELSSLRNGQRQVLELGSGPGFLAEYLLQALPDLRLSLLDFSPAMHDLARARLVEHSAAANFVQRDLKESNWAAGLGSFDAVITNQSVHELRHKRHASTLHTQVRRILKPGGPYLVADHFCGKGGMGNARLYMTVDEQAQALLGAGFSSVALVARSGSLAMHRANRQ